MISEKPDGCGKKMLKLKLDQNVQHVLLMQTVTEAAMPN